MTHRLVAFEFIAAGSGPSIVRLSRNSMVIAQFAFVDWIAVDLRPFQPLTFSAKEDLVVEGEGLGHPYWDNEVPPWLVSFDGISEGKRIKAIKDAATREINRARISMP